MSNDYLETAVALIFADGNNTCETCSNFVWGQGGPDPARCLVLEGDNSLDECPALSGFIEAKIADLESSLAEAERKPACWHMTGGEIRDLCAFAGFTVMEADPDMMETEYTIQACPESGLYDPDDGKWTRYKQVVSLTEYPEEGFSGLGLVINGGGKS